MLPNKIYVWSHNEICAKSKHTIPILKQKEQKGAIIVVRRRRNRMSRNRKRRRKRRASAKKKMKNNIFSSHNYKDKNIERLITTVINYQLFMEADT